IVAALTSVNEARCRPPLAQWQIEKIATSISRYPPDAPLLATVVMGGSIPPPDEPNGGTETQRKLEEVDFVDLSLEPGVSEPTFLPLLNCPGYLVRDWKNLVSAYPKVGKTELILACCRSWIEQGETVLWVSEEHRCVWKLRTAHKRDIPRGLQLVFGFGEPLELLFERVCLRAVQRRAASLAAAELSSWPP